MFKYLCNLNYIVSFIWHGTSIKQYSRSDIQLLFKLQKFSKPNETHFRTTTDYFAIKVLSQKFPLRFNAYHANRKVDSLGETGNKPIYWSFNVRLSPAITGFYMQTALFDKNT